MKQIQILMLASTLLLTSCAKWGSDDEDNNPYQGMSAKQLFTQGEQEISQGEYTSASKHLEALETQYPFSDYAERAQLDLIYTYYKKEDYASSAATAERFIHLYPRSSRVDYAYYMKGLANFQQTRGTFANVLPLDESWRDSGTITQAYNDFTLLVQRFPNSRYKPNAMQRLIYIRNLFAKRELNTANYYFERKMYVAAVERAGYVVKNYPQSPSAEKALIVMYKANRALGLNQAAEEASIVYKATYHKSLAN